jgi:filamentous hemagglutinin
MSTNSASYQSFVTGAPAGTAYQLNGVNFDGEVPGGPLVEAKASYDFAIAPDGTFQGWFTGGQGLVDQALRQIDAAEGRPIVWYAQTEATANAITKLFARDGITIPVIFKPGP